MTSLTVTATQAGSGDTFNGMILAVRVLTGAKARASQTGATGTFNGTTTHHVSVTTTTAGSWVFGGLSECSNDTFVSPEATTSQIIQTVDATNQATYIAFGPVSPTVTPGATVFGYTDSFATGTTVTAAEILPNGTIAVDGSTPAAASTTAATAVTSASFSPPGGSLLVAVVASDSANGSFTISMSDTLSLTWTQLVFAANSNFAGSGVWVADVPGSAAAPSLLMCGIV